MIRDLKPSIIEIYSDIKKQENIEGQKNGEIVNLLPLDTMQTIPCKFLLNVLVSPVFYNELCAVDQNNASSYLNMMGRPPTIFSVPIYIEKHQREDFKVVSR